MVCKNCSKTIDMEGRFGTVRYCPDCGELLIKCMECDMPLKEGDSYCHACGTICEANTDVIEECGSMEEEGIDNG